MRESAHTSTKSACECRPAARRRQGNNGRERLSGGASCAIVCARLVVAHAPAHAFAWAVKWEFVVLHELDASPRTLVPISPSLFADDMARAMHAAMSGAWLSVGIGCRLHSSDEQIEAAVRAALGTYRFDQIRVVASIDSKSHEAGLLDFCTRHALPLVLFSREQIATVLVETGSTAAKKHLGVDGVGEPCALLAAAGESAASASPAVSAAATTAEPATSRARLIVRKTIHAGVTVAIATSADNAIQQQDLP